VRAVFLDENLGGHATLHLHLERAIEPDPRIDATFVHVPPPRLVRRVASVPIPGLAGRDLDLQPLRSQLALSAHARRMVAPALAGADVLHAYTQNVALMLGPVLRRIPTVVTIDATNALHAFRLPYRRPTRWTERTLPASLFFERRVFEAARLVVAQSEYAATSLRTTYGLPDAKIRVLRFGITDHGGELATPEVGRPRITFVGNALERKGGLALQRVFTRHLADRADLTLITRDDVTPEPGVRVVNDISPGDPRLWAELRASSIFALPSEIDYSPNAILEAMAAGLPIVAARTGAVPEVVEHGVNGLLVEPGDEADLTRRLSELIDEPDRRAQMGAASRKLFEERWNAANEGRRLVDLLLEVAGGTRSSRRC
jgi:starch synthase